MCDRDVDGYGRFARRLEIVVGRLDRGRMPGAAIVGRSTDRGTEVLIHEAWVNARGCRRRLHAVGPHDDQLGRGSLLTRDQHGGRADVGVEDDDVGMHLSEDVGQIHVVRGAPDDLEPLALDQVMERSRRVVLRQQDANHRRSSSDIEAQWFTPPDRIVVHDGHPRAARFRLILRRGRGVVKGLDGLGWSRYGTP
ncbi:MAG TPA: hypothetical protein VE817_02505 [Candidatus Acidoferrum sp.]|nr:hypothetical protein [Candidatus Acidoferrum sp.]